MSFWSSMKTSLSGLNAQRLRMDLIANNIANAETTRTEDGGPYKRKDVVFIPQGGRNIFPNMLLREQNKNALLGSQMDGGGVLATEITVDDGPGPRVYDPTHPDADEEGFVEYPNVNLVVEMTNLLSATRSYEANLAVVEANKRMAIRAIEIGR